MRPARPVCSRALLVALLACALLLSGRASAQPCTGDCNRDGSVTVDELILAADIELGASPWSSCATVDANADGQVEINELVLAIGQALNGCAGPAVTPSATTSPTLSAVPSASSTPTVTPVDTVTATPSTTLTPTATETPTVSSTLTPTATLAGGAISIADAVARDARGVAVRLGQSVTTEGVVTVQAGAFANGKLKIFAQSDGAGIMVYHQTSAAVPAFQRGDRLRVTGVIRQVDPTGGGDNLAAGTVLVDLTSGAWDILSMGNPLPDPVPITLPDLAAQGIALTGTLVHVAALQKVAGDWPKFGDRSTAVTVGDGAATAMMRFQRPVITLPLSDLLTTIGNNPFAATAIVVQDDRSPDGSRLGGFELWIRGADDIQASSP